MLRVGPAGSVNVAQRINGNVVCSLTQLATYVGGEYEGLAAWSELGDERIAAAKLVAVVLVGVEYWKVVGEGLSHDDHVALPVNREAVNIVPAGTAEERRIGQG